MLKLYYARPSVYARPVWLALLEKQVPFELIPVDLEGEQFDPEFVAISPFSHIPVLIDGDLRIIESLAILDYLEARYPDPPLWPTDPIQLAQARMAQMVALNELLPAVVTLLINFGKEAKRPADVEYARLRADRSQRFLEDLLGENPYLGGDQFTLAEIVAGPLVDRLSGLGIDLERHPQLNRWFTTLQTRPTWHQIALSQEEWQRFDRFMRVIPRLWERRRRLRMAAWSQG